MAQSVKKPSIEEISYKLEKTPKKENYSIVRYHLTYSLRVIHDEDKGLVGVIGFVKNDGGVFVPDAPLKFGREREKGIGFAQYLYSGQMLQEVLNEVNDTPYGVEKILRHEVPFYIGHERSSNPPLNSRQYPTIKVMEVGHVFLDAKVLTE